MEELFELQTFKPNFFKRHFLSRLAKHQKGEILWLIKEVKTKTQWERLETS